MRFRHGARSEAQNPELNAPGWCVEGGCGGVGEAPPCRLGATLGLLASPGPKSGMRFRQGARSEAQNPDLNAPGLCVEGGCGGVGEAPPRRLGAICFWGPHIVFTVELYCIFLYCIIVYCIVWSCIVLYCIVLYCVVLHCVVLHCIALYCAVVYCIVLCCVVLYCVIM